MTRDEANARRRQLNHDESRDEQWFVKQVGPADWELVSVPVPGGPHGPSKTAVQATPRPQVAPDPRPAIMRNIPPYGPI